jgi:hypothetical protein
VACGLLRGADGRLASLLIAKPVPVLQFLGNTLKTSMPSALSGVCIDHA